MKKNYSYQTKIAIAEFGPVILEGNCKRTDTTFELTQVIEGKLLHREFSKTNGMEIVRKRKRDGNLT